MSKNSKVSDLFEMIDQCKKESIIIAIDGHAGSGKSTLASLIKEKYNATVFHLDDYFLQPHQRTKQRLNEIGGNVDYERFLLEVLIPIETNLNIEFQKFDCQLQKLLPKIIIKPSKIIVIEGSYCHRPEFCHHYDIKVALHIDTEVQKKRILDRNGQQRYLDFINKWIPLENKYFEHYNIFDNAHLCIDTNHT